MALPTYPYIDKKFYGIHSADNGSNKCKPFTRQELLSRQKPAVHLYNWQKNRVYEFAKKEGLELVELVKLTATDEDAMTNLIAFVWNVHEGIHFDAEESQVIAAVLKNWLTAHSKDEMIPHSVTKYPDPRDVTVSATPPIFKPSPPSHPPRPSSVATAASSGTIPKAVDQLRRDEVEAAADGAAAANGPRTSRLLVRQQGMDNLKDPGTPITPHEAVPSVTPVFQDADPLAKRTTKTATPHAEAGNVPRPMSAESIAIPPSSPSAAEYPDLSAGFASTSSPPRSDYTDKKPFGYSQRRLLLSLAANRRRMREIEQELDNLSLAKSEQTREEDGDGDLWKSGDVSEDT